MRKAGDRLAARFRDQAVAVDETDGGAERRRGEGSVGGPTA
jgi:hypothetical protein